MEMEHQYKIARVLETIERIVKMQMKEKARRNTERNWGMKKKNFKVNWVQKMENRLELAKIKFSYWKKITKV